MSTDDIIKAREGLATNLSVAMENHDADYLRDAREALAAFERLVAEPVPSAPQMPMRAHIATQVAGHFVAAFIGRDYAAKSENVVANMSVQLADALIERLKRP